MISKSSKGVYPILTPPLTILVPVIDKYQFDMIVLCQHDNVGLTAYMSQRSDGSLFTRALSTLYLFPKHKKEAESIICSQPLAVLLSLRQKSGYPKIP